MDQDAAKAARTAWEQDPTFDTLRALVDVLADSTVHARSSPLIGRTLEDR